MITTKIQTASELLSEHFSHNNSLQLQNDVSFTARICAQNNIRNTTSLVIFERVFIQIADQLHIQFVDECNNGDKYA